MKKATAKTTPKKATPTAKVRYTNDLLTAYENAVKMRLTLDPDPERLGRDPAVGALLQNVALYATRAVLKRLRSVNGDIAFDLSRDLEADCNNIDRVYYTVDNDHSTGYNADGETETVYNDLHKVAHKITSLTLSDSYDLVQTAVLTLWMETKKAIASGRAETTDHFLTDPFTRKKLKRKVYIKDDPSVSAEWETVETSIIQIVFKSVRKYIIDTKEGYGTKYIYIADTVTDPDNPETVETVYKRLDRLTASLSADSITTDISGERPTATTPTADSETVKKATDLITALNLTNRQATILAYKMRGYGYKAIGERLKIRPDNVRNSLREIQKKAIKIGLTPN